MKFSIIVAMDRNHGIGKNGGLPWELPEDLKHFRRITTAVNDSTKKNVVVMGRKTWQSLPAEYKPLPNRVNVVLTRNDSCPLPEGVFRCGSFSELNITLNGLSNIEKVFVIGGEQIFKEAVKNSSCQEIFLTQIAQIFDCDTFFPIINVNYKLSEKLGQGESSGLNYIFYRFVPKSE